MTTDTQTAATSPAIREMGEGHVKRLSAWTRRADRWDAACDALTADRDNPVVLAAWMKAQRSMPSKNSKYRAYADADWLVRYLPLDMPRPETRDDLKAIERAARAKLGMRPAR